MPSWTKKKDIQDQKYQAYVASANLALYKYNMICFGDIPHICHWRHGQRLCQFFLPGVNFYRFNAKNWRFFTDLTRKIGVFFFYRFNAKNWRFSV